MSDKVVIALFWGAAKIAITLFGTNDGKKEYAKTVLDKTLELARLETEKEAMRNE